MNFNRITLATPTGGTVSLEGGSDFGAGSDRDSVFYIAANGAPAAVNDTATTDEDTAVSGNVLTNDTDPENNALTATLVAGPSQGTVSLAPSGAFTYTPNSNYNGLDSFTYTASDGTSSTQATVSITVRPVNDPPSAANDTVNTNEDPSPAPTFNVLTNDTDVDGDALTVLSHTNPAKGTLVNNGGGGFTYTPVTNDSGTYTFTYTAKDPAGLTSTATVTINVAPVNDPPVANDDPTPVNDRYPVQKNTPTQITDVLVNDTDLDGGSLTIDPTSVTNGEHGTAVLQADKKTILYTPDTSYVGIDTFTYQASDGVNLSNIATVRVRVCGDSTGPLPPGVTASFERLNNPTACKSNTISFDLTDTSILFQPDGSSPTPVDYRGVITFGPKAPVVDGVGGTVLSLKYDVTGIGDNYEPVPWCINPHFTGGLVDGATLPTGDTWCIATETTTGQQVPGSTNVITTWQVFGQDDPKFQ
jgi:VCBS repeat-containing protein